MFSFFLSVNQKLLDVHPSLGPSDLANTKLQGTTVEFGF